MQGRCVKSLSALGFLTVLDAPPHGLIGGYLLLNPLGRPLEFHCTAPVKANRAQQILYGPTLRPYLYAEQIGQTLVAKAQQRPPIVLTDSPPVLELRNYVDTPVALVLAGGEAPEADPGPGDPLQQADITSSRPASHRFYVDGPQATGPKLTTLCLAHQRLAVAAEQDGDLALLQAELTAVAQKLDLAEPFARIREAICEAQRIKRQD